MSGISIPDNSMSGIILEYYSNYSTHKTIMYFLDFYNIIYFFLKLGIKV